MKEQLQSGKIDIPSLAGAAVDVTLGEVDDETAETHDQQGNDQSPKTRRSGANASIHEHAISPVVIHDRRSKHDTPL